MHFCDGGLHFDGMQGSILTCFLHVSARSQLIDKAYIIILSLTTDCMQAKYV